MSDRIARERQPPLTEAEKEALLRAAAKWVTDAHEVLTGTGAHAEHTRQQLGRCCFCSCGMRVQGRMADA